MRRIIGLEKGAAFGFAASGTACDLLQHLEGAFGGARIARG